jgi:hypothetical protein
VAEIAQVLFQYFANRYQNEMIVSDCATGRICFINLPIDKGLPLLYPTLLSMAVSDEQVLVTDKQ